MTDPNAPQVDADSTSATDEELTAASGGRGESGDGFIVGDEGIDQHIVP